MRPREGGKWNPDGLTCGDARHEAGLGTENPSYGSRQGRRPGAPGKTRGLTRVSGRAKGDHHMRWRGKRRAQAETMGAASEPPGVQEFNEHHKSISGRSVLPLNEDGLAQVWTRSRPFVGWHLAGKGFNLFLSLPSFSQFPKAVYG